MGTSGTVRGEGGNILTYSAIKIAGVSLITTYRLSGVADPEQKRKIIGREFVELFQREAAKVKGARWLAESFFQPPDADDGKSDGKNDSPRKKLYA